MTEFCIAAAESVIDSFRQVVSMEELTPFPHRRWFQFSLSTWFVLVAILAWAMWLRPTIDWGSADLPDAWSKWNRMGIMIQTNMHLPGNYDAPEAEDSLDNLGFAWYRRSDNSPWVQFSSIRVTPKSSLSPALALAAFVGWKATGAIRRRVRSKSAPELADPRVARNQF